MTYHIIHGKLLKILYDYISSNLYNRAANIVLDLPRIKKSTTRQDIKHLLDFGECAFQVWTCLGTKFQVDRPRHFELSFQKDLNCLHLVNLRFKFATPKLIDVLWDLQESDCVPNL